MARRPNNEFAGTGDEPVEPIDPATLVGDSGGTPGNGGGTDGDFDPAIHAGRDKFNADGSFRRKRGRKAGTGSGSTGSKATHPVNLAGIETVLLSIHSMMAVALKAPEMALDKDEAKAMTDAIAEVAKHYPMTVDPKTMAWINLAMCSSMTYGPRIYMIRKRQNDEKEEKKQPVNLFSVQGQ